MQTITHNLGNNETQSTGIFPERDGSFLAMTRLESKKFKTLKGAQKWMAARGFKSA